MGVGVRGSWEKKCGNDFVPKKLAGGMNFDDTSRSWSKENRVSNLVFHNLFIS